MFTLSFTFIVSCFRKLSPDKSVQLLWYNKRYHLLPILLFINSAINAQAHTIAASNLISKSWNKSGRIDTHHVSDFGGRMSRRSYTVI